MYTNNLPDGLRLKSFSFDVRSREMNINILISSLHSFGNTLSARDINIQIQHTHKGTKICLRMCKNSPFACHSGNGLPAIVNF